MYEGSPTNNNESYLYSSASPSPCRKGMESPRNACSLRETKRRRENRSDLAEYSTVEPKDQRYRRHRSTGSHASFFARRWNGLLQHAILHPVRKQRNGRKLILFVWKTRIVHQTAYVSSTTDTHHRPRNPRPP